MSCYELFHDESGKGGYWHGMFLVPVAKKEAMLALLEAARGNVQYQHKISFKQINRRGARFDLADAWLSLAVGFMRSEGKGLAYHYFSGKQSAGGKEYQRLDEGVTGAKFVLFREQDHENLLHYPDETSKVETMFRMGMKGGLHFLFTERSPVELLGLHFDGYEHQGRHIDRARVISRLSGLRQYCTISQEKDLIDDRGSDPAKAGAQSYADCQFLQLTDLLIGAFRSAFGYYSNDCQWILARYARTLITRYAQGRARMEKSRWRRAFCMSQCRLEDEAWVFEEIELAEVAAAQQPGLFS